MRTLSLFLVAAAAATVGSLVACSNYNPDLGSTPFKCTATDPTCPDSYTCQMDIGVCVADGGTTPDGPGADSAAFQCANDGNLEPNNTYQTAYVTDVGAVPTRAFGPLSICPAGDKDTFKVNMPSGTMKSLEMKVTWDSGATLTGVLLNAGGTVLQQAVPLGDKGVRACAALPAGMFYAQVAGAAEVQNNYRITLTVVASCANP